VNHAIQTVNAHLIAPTLEQLKQIKVVITAAGGPNKHDVLWSVLTRKDFGFIRGLCTDQKTAEALLRRKTDRESSLE
jgi:DNA-binding transcriptional regulator LsrR (DeoR family)